MSKRDEWSGPKIVVYEKIGSVAVRANMEAYKVADAAEFCSDIAAYQQAFLLSVLYGVRVMDGRNNCAKVHAGFVEWMKKREDYAQWLEATGQTNEGD